MRTSKHSMPNDPKCRPWGAHEAARRRRQAGFAHSLAQSQALDVNQAIFRTAKAEREVARQAKVAESAATRAAVRAAVTP